MEKQRFCAFPGQNEGPDMAFTMHKHCFFRNLMIFLLKKLPLFEQQMPE